MSLFLRSCAAILFSVLLVMENSRAQDHLTLQQAIAIAMANHPKVLVGQKEIEAARARVLQAEAIPNVEFGLNWDETPSNFDLSAAGERNLGLVQPFEFPGKRGARGRLATVDARFFEEHLAPDGATGG